MKSKIRICMLAPTFLVMGALIGCGGGGKSPTTKEWYEDSSYINGLTASDIGITKDVTVNGKVHKVRLIGIDHDDLATGNGKAHTTWEFANLLCDSNGDSLAYQWNDTNDSETSNYDYQNSTINYALNGIGNNGGKTGEKATEILVAQKGQTTWSTDSNYKKPVIDMLPTGLKNNIKSVNKKVLVFKEKTETRYIFNEEIHSNKLFLLSLAEFGMEIPFTPETDTPYKYYEGHTSYEEPEPFRVKKPLNNVVNKNFPKIESGQTYLGLVENYAGYNNATDESNGGIYWSRTPLCNDAAIILWDGMLDDDGVVYRNALSIAPAFCI